MFAACVVVTILLALALLGSAVAKFTRSQRVVTQLTGLGVPIGWFPLLGAAEVAGGLGLLVGLALPPVGIAAAVGVILYFTGAVATHVKAGDSAIAPPAVLGLLAVVSLLLRVATL